MSSTLFPLPIAQSQIRRNLAGLGNLLKAVAEFTGETFAQLIDDPIRAAQSELEGITRMPFFVTRFCTEEIAARPNPENLAIPALVQGTDYDLICQPQDYIIEDWAAGMGKVRAPWRPVDDVALWRFTFRSGGHIVDLPLEWLNYNAETGVLSIMPHGIGVDAVQYFRLLLLFPFYRGAPAGTIIPHLIHLRFSAGLVDPVEFAAPGDGCDPSEAALAAPQATKWDQNLVRAYQKAIGQYAAAKVMRDLAGELDRGGASISFAGLSESVNPTILWTRAESLETGAKQWAERLVQQQYGPVFVTV